MNTRYLCPHGGDLLDKTVRSVSRSVSRPGISLPTTHVIMTLNFSYLCVQDGCFDASSRTFVADHRFPWLVVARPGHRSHTTLSYTFHSHATLLHRSLPRTTLSRTLLRHTYLSHTTLPPTAFERKKLFLHTHPFHMQHFRAQLFYTHLRQLLHATLSHTTLSHIAHFRIQLFKTIDPPASPLSFLPSPYRFRLEEVDLWGYPVLEFLHPGTARSHGNTTRNGGITIKIRDLSDLT